VRTSATSSGGLQVGIQVDGLKETLRAFNAYGRDANKELRAAAGGLVDQLVPVIMVAAGAAGPQAALAASSVRRVSDRVPAIGAGGTRRVNPSRGSTRSFATRPKKLSNKVTGGDVFFGAEFGGGRKPTTRQFPPWTGTAGRWFFPTIRRATPKLMADYRRVLDDLADRFDRGGNE